MKAIDALLLTVITISVLIFAGCTKPYVITTELEGSLTPSMNCTITEMKDELPAGFPDEKKPSKEDLNKFNNYLIEELEKSELFRAVAYSFPSNNKYEVSGAVLDYKKGSGFLRVMFGAWAGSANTIVSLKLIDKKSGEVIFSGNFNGVVTSWAESGDKMFKQVAQNFVKAIKKQNKKLLKGTK